MSPDNPERLRSFHEAEGLPFPILHDPEGSVNLRFGIRNENDDRSIPHPTALVIDRDGVVRYRRTDENYRERPPVDEILEILAGL